jgi:predicted transcriptional regulator
MARSQHSASTLMRRQLESEIARFRQQISVCQNEISLREKVLHDLDALDGRTPTGFASKPQPPAIAGKVGLTDAIREIFHRAHTELSAPEIREHLISSGFAPRSNFLVMIHSTLSRLEKAGEIDKRAKTGKWVAVQTLRSDASEKGLVLIPARNASQGETQQTTTEPSISTERSPLPRADKVELILKLRGEGRTNKEIAKALGMDTHAFQCYVTTLIKRGLLKRREPGRRARNILHAAGENL